MILSRIRLDQVILLIGIQNIMNMKNMDILGREEIMKIIRAWEKNGVDIPAPYKRKIKVLLAPDKEDVKEITFCQAILSPESKTDCHTHDRPELIYVVSGEGVFFDEGGYTPITADVVLWVPAGEKHQVINTGYAPLKLATLFVPAYRSDEVCSPCIHAAERGEKNQ